MKKIKPHWYKDESGDWHGSLPLHFCIFKDGRKLKMQIHESDKKPETRSRFIEVKSVQQGKNIAAGIMKNLFEK